MARAYSGSLGEWIVGVRFPQWKKNRRHAEDKWNAALAAYRIRPDISYAATTANNERKAGEIGYPLTRQKVTTAHAALRDVILPGNRLSFMLVPENENDEKLLHDPKILSEIPDQTGLLSPEADRAAGIREDVAAAESQLVEQLEACDGPEEVNQALFAGTLYGVMFMKRGIGTIEQERFVEVEPGVYVPEITEDNAVSIEYIDQWSMYWDMESHRLQDGDGCIYRDYISPAELRNCIGKPLYHAPAIKRVLEQNQAQSDQAGKGTEEAPKRQAVEEASRNIETFEFWGIVPAAAARKFEEQISEESEPETTETGVTETTDAEEKAGAGTESNREDEDAGRMVEVHAIVCNMGGESAGPEVIRFARTRRQDRPFFKADLIWEPDELTGSGVADLVANEQRVLNDLVKSLTANADQAARLIFGTRQALADGTVNVTRKGEAIVISLDESNTSDIREVLSQFQVQTAIRELIETIESFIAYADLSSGIPRAEQGSQEPTPQTLGELRERMNRAGKFLGAILLNVDRMIEDIIRSMYRWNLINPEIRRGKGKYRVKALGYTGFMSKVEKVAGLLRILELALSNHRLERETNIRRLWEDVIRAHDLDTDEALRPPADVAADDRAEAEAQAAEAEAAAGAALPEETPPLTQEEQIGQQLALEAQEAEIEKDRADAEHKRASAEEKRSKTRIERAEKAAGLMRGAQPISPGAVNNTEGAI